MSDVSNKRYKWLAWLPFLVGTGISLSSFYYKMDVFSWVDEKDRTIVSAAFSSVGILFSAIWTIQAIMSNTAKETNLALENLNKNFGKFSFNVLEPIEGIQNIENALKESSIKRVYNTRMEWYQNDSNLGEKITEYRTKSLLPIVKRGRVEVYEIISKGFETECKKIEKECKKGNYKLIIEENFQLPDMVVIEKSRGNSEMWIMFQPLGEPDRCFHFDNKEIVQASIKSLKKISAKQR